MKKYDESRREMLNAEEGQGLIQGDRPLQLRDKGSDHEDSQLVCS